MTVPASPRCARAPCIPPPALGNVPFIPVLISVVAAPLYGSGSPWPGAELPFQATTIINGSLLFSPFILRICKPSVSLPSSWEPLGTAPQPVPSVGV